MIGEDRDELMTPSGQIAWIVPFLKVPPPAGWHLISKAIDGNCYGREDRISVIVSGDRALDGKRWIHISLARPNKMPTWDEYRDVGRLFLWEEAWAYQVIAPKGRYINQHPYCLHMFACVDGPQLPDFARGQNHL